MAGEALAICPDVYTYADREHNKLTIEAEVPGVEKQDITVNMHDDSMSLYAPRKEGGGGLRSFCLLLLPCEAHRGEGQVRERSRQLPPREQGGLCLSKKSRHNGQVD